MGAVRKVRVAVIVFNANDELLVCRQNNHPFWVLPGGTLEADETIFECAERELMEEAGLKVSAQQLVVLSEFFPKAGKTPTVDMTVFATLAGGQLTPTAEENINEMQWVGLEALPAVNLQPAYLVPLLQHHGPTKQFPQAMVGVPHYAA